MIGDGQYHGAVRESNHELLLIVARVVLEAPAGPGYPGEGHPRLVATAHSQKFSRSKHGMAPSPLDTVASMWYDKSMVRITAPWFVAGVVLGKRAAPIVRYMVPWTLDQIRAYCAKRGWQVEVLD